MRSEEREARLRTNRINSLVGETSEDREARLEHARDFQWQQLLTLCEVKMSKYHADLASFKVSRCTPCSEVILGLFLHSRECQQCSRDKHIPKLYSSANNMNPGPVLPQLQVSLVINPSAIEFHTNKFNSL